MPTGSSEGGRALVRVQPRCGSRGQLRGTARLPCPGHGSRHPWSSGAFLGKRSTTCSEMSIPPPVSAESPKVFSFVANQELAGNTFWMQAPSIRTEPTMEISTEAPSHLRLQTMF